MTQRSWRQPFQVQSGEAGVWHLESPRVRVILTGVDGEAQVPREPIGEVAIDWQKDGVSVALDGARPITVRARAALVHEPQRALYSVLPLCSFEPAQRRLWWRIFRLIQLPGAVLLLRWLSGRGKAKKG